MIYPRHFEGLQTVDGGRLYLHAPDKLVEEAGQLLEPESRILEIGAGNGRNGTYLAMQGHEVVSLEVNADYIENGHRILRGLGSRAIKHTFIEADMTNFDIMAEIGQVDAVIACRSLQEVAKNESYAMIKKMQDVTNPGGLNVIRAYIATPEQQEMMPHRALFEPEELPRIYGVSGWVQIKHPDDEIVPLESHGKGTLYCQSTTELITKKLSIKEKIRADLLHEAESYRRTDPERYDLLVEQANAK